MGANYYFDDIKVGKQPVALKEYHAKNWFEKLQESMARHSCCYISTTKIILKMGINSLPNDKFLDWSRFKAFEDNKINVSERLKFVLGSWENIVGKGENAGYQHFLLFRQCFPKSSFSRSLSWYCVVKGLIPDDFWNLVWLYSSIIW